MSEAPRPTPIQPTEIPIDVEAAFDPELRQARRDMQEYLGGRPENEQDTHGHETVDDLHDARREEHYKETEAATAVNYDEMSPKQVYDRLYDAVRRDDRTAIIETRDALQDKIAGEVASYTLPAIARLEAQQEHEDWEMFSDVEDLQLTPLVSNVLAERFEAEEQRLAGLRNESRERVAETAEGEENGGGASLADHMKGNEFDDLAREQRWQRLRGVHDREAARLQAADAAEAQRQADLLAEPGRLDLGADPFERPDNERDEVPVPDSELPWHEDDERDHDEFYPFDEGGRDNPDSQPAPEDRGPGGGEPDPGDDGPGGAGPEGARRFERNPDGSWNVKYEPLRVGRNGEGETPVQVARRWDEGNFGREFNLSWRDRTYTAGVDNPVIIRVGHPDRQDEEDAMHIFLMQDQAYRIIPDEGSLGGYRAEDLGPIPDGATAFVGAALRGLGWARAGGYRVLGVEGGGEMVDDGYESQALEGHIPGGPNQLLIDRMLVDRDVRHAGLSFDRGRHGLVEADPRGQGFRPEMFDRDDPWGNAAVLTRAAEEVEARERTGDIARRQEEEAARQRYEAQFPPRQLARYAAAIEAAQVGAGRPELTDDQVMTRARRAMLRDLGERGLARARRAEARGDELEVGQVVPTRTGRARQVAGRAARRVGEAADRAGLTVRLGDGEVMTDPGDTRMLEERRPGVVSRATGYARDLRAQAVQRRNFGAGPFPDTEAQAQIPTARERIAADLGGLVGRAVRRGGRPQEAVDDGDEGGEQGGGRRQPRHRREGRGAARRRARREGAMGRLDGMLGDGGPSPETRDNEPR